MKLRLLGPLEATADGRSLVLGAKKQRAVLAMLALEVNRVVSSERLIEGLWGPEAPASAPKMVQLYISQLRKLLRGSGADIVTQGRGYCLRCAPGDVDVAQLEQMLDGVDGHARSALELWRGPPLVDVADEPFAGPEIRRLEELRLRAEELAIDADLAAGRHEEVLAELAALVAEHPLREHLQAQWMLALYRSGRQGDALDAYRRARAALVEQVGAEPGPELRRLHEAILHQDEQLVAPPRAPGGAGRAPSPAQPPRRALWALAALLLAAAGVAFALATRGDGSRAIAGDAVGLVDAQADVAGPVYRVGRGPIAAALGGGSVWTASRLDGTVSRIDRGAGRLTTIDVGPDPTGIAYGEGSLWVADGQSRSVAQVDPTTDKVVQRIDVGGLPAAVAVGFGAVWVAEPFEGRLVRIELARGRATQRIPISAGPVAVAAGAGGVWVARVDAGDVVRVDPRSGATTASVNVGNGPAAVAVGAGAVWVANRPDGTVSRIDPAAGRVTTTVHTGREAGALAAGPGGVWVADGATDTVVRLDPASGRVRATLRLRTSPTALAAAGDSAWVAAVAARATHRGGTLRVRGTACGYPDCQDSSTSDNAATELYGLAYDGLVGYRRVAGAAGDTLVGALATRVPPPQDGGLTYVFTLRPGLRYSDGRPVRATDVRASLERTLRLHGRDLPDWYSAIAGAPGCLRAPARCNLARGIVADPAARTVTFHLTRPDPALVPELALPPASILPAGVRPAEERAAPGTGPYRIVSATPDATTRLVRNPYFRTWSPADRPDGFADAIEIDRSDTLGAQIAAVRHGRADLASVDNGAHPLPAAQLAGLTTRYASRLSFGPRLAVDFMFMNVRVPPFDDVRVRRAVNLATDRARVVALWHGGRVAEPACQLLPPTLPGSVPYCPYTVAPSPAGTWTGPDLAKARALIAASGTRGMRVRVWSDTDKAQFGRYFGRLLARLGYRTSVRILPVGFPYIKAVADSRTRAQIGMFGWAADYPSPLTFFRPIFDCAHRIPAAPWNLNLSQLCDRALDRDVARALRVDGIEGGDAWRAAERRLADLAPGVALDVRRRIVFASARAGGVQQHPMWGTLLEQVWVR